MKKKGFTLVEMVIVVAIIGLLLAIAIPRYLGTVQMSRNIKIEANARTILSLVHGEYLKNNMHPSQSKLDELISSLNINSTGISYSCSITPEDMVLIHYESSSNLYSGKNGFVLRPAVDDLTDESKLNDGSAISSVWFAYMIGNPE